MDLLWSQEFPSLENIKCEGRCIGSFLHFFGTIIQCGQTNLTVSPGNKDELWRKILDFRVLLFWNFYVIFSIVESIFSQYIIVFLLQIFDFEMWCRLSSGYSHEPAEHCWFSRSFVIYHQGGQLDHFLKKNIYHLLILNCFQLLQFFYE